jgi:hypothetical protein
MPSAQDVYITPASSVIDIYSGSTKNLYLSGSTHGYIHGASDLKITADDDISLIGGGGGSIVTFGVGGAEKMRLTEAGNFGIGTPAPAQKLYVSGGATSLDNAGGVSLYLKNAGSTYLSFDSYGGPGVSIATPADMHVSGATGITFKTAANGIVLAPTGTSAGDTLPLRFRELAANGSATIRVRAPDSISNENTWVLPPDIGTANQVLTVASVASTEMTLDWADASGGGTIGGSITDNQVAFGASTSNSIEGSADLTYDGYKLTIGRTAGNEARGVRILDDEGTETISLITSSSDHGLLYLRGATGGNSIYLDANGASYINGGYIGFGTTSPDNQAEVTVVGKIYANIDANGNLAVGSGSFAHTSGIGNYSGYYSTGIGVETLKTISGAAHRNTAVGYRAMFGDSTGTEGTDNTGIGAYALQNIKDGQYNVAVGGGAGLSITDATDNTFIGLNSGKFNTTSNYSTAVGSQAMGTLDGAGTSTAVGYFAMNAHSGDNSVALGAYAMRTGSNAYNVAVGVSAMTKVSGGAGGVAVGFQSGYHPTGNYNTWVGYLAGFGTAGAAANLNVGIGHQAMMNANGAVANTAVGPSAGQNLTNGDYNTFLGRNAGYQAQTGDYNTLLGVNAGTSQTTQSGNTLIGYNAGASVTAEYITAIGYAALGAGAGANYDVAIGFQAHNAGTGRGVFIGLQAGKETTGTGVLIGSEAGETNTSSSLVLIGHEAGKMVSGTTAGMTSVGHGVSTNASGTYHTMFGQSAGNQLKGNVNTGVGYKVLQSGTNATHQNNTAMGYQAMQGGNYSVTNQDNVAIGVNTLRYASGSGWNVAIGNYAMGATDQEGLQNVAVGYYALSGATGANAVTAVGHLSARDLTTGDSHVAIGKSAMLKVTTSSYNTVIGVDALSDVDGAGSTTAVGFGAMKYSSADNATGIGQYALSGATGDKNAALGNSAGAIAKGSANSVMVGYQAGLRPTGNHNVWMGYRAGYGVVDQGAQNNVGIGKEAMLNVTTGQENVAVGDQAGYAITTANYSVGIGTDALRGVTTGVGNIGIGRYAGAGGGTDSYSISIGSSAGQDATSTNAISIGQNAGFQLTGDHNVAIGKNALQDGTSAFYNIAIGWGAGKNVTEGDSNTIVGNNAGEAMTTQNENVLIGQVAGQDLTGQYNVFVGSAAGFNATSADSNVAIGRQAMGSAVLTGDSNVAIGYTAGHTASSASLNVLVGQGAGYGITTAQKSVVIGHNAGYVMAGQGGSVIIGFEAGRLQDAGSGGSVAIGHQALYSGTQNYQDVAIGINAGRKATGASASNVFLGRYAGPSTAGVVQNKLYINNAEGTPLIYGDFSAPSVTINGTLDMPTNHGITFDNTNNNNQYFISNRGSNAATLVFGIGAIDNANAKITMDGDGDLGIGTTVPGAKLDIVSTSDNNTGGIRIGDGTNFCALYTDSNENFIIDPTNDFIVTGSDDIKLECNDDFQMIADDFYFLSGSQSILNIKYDAGGVTNYRGTVGKIWT